MKRKTLALIAISVTILGAGSFAFYIYAFTTDGIPTGTCPEFSFVSGPPNIPFKIISVGNTYHYDMGSGPISWCIYGSNNLLGRSYQTDRILNTPTVSANGEYVVASGYQIGPGPPGPEENGAIYSFDKSGRMLWNVTDSQLFWASEINSNGSVVIGYGVDLYYINDQGRVLWNYSNPNKESFTAALVNNGSYVADGISNVLYPNSTNFGSSLVLFDSTGKTVWNDSIYQQTIVSARSLAFSNGHIALGVSVSGFQGTLLYYDLQGKLIWSKQVNSAVLDVGFRNNGSQIYVETNWGHLVFDSNGNQIGAA